MPSKIIANGLTGLLAPLHTQSAELPIAGRFGRRRACRRCGGLFLARSPGFSPKSRLLLRADQLGEQQQWSEAASYLFRYLQLDPGDTGVRVRLAETYDRAAVTAAAKRRSIDFFYRAVGVAPDRLDLRLGWRNSCWNRVPTAARGSRPRRC